MRTMAARGRRAPRFALGVLLALAAAACGADEPEQRTVEQVKEERNAELRAMPEYRERFPATMDQRQVAQQAARIALEGRSRMHDTALVTRARIQSRILAAVDTPTCATIGRGWAAGFDRPPVAAALATLEPDARATWEDLRYQALIAGLRERTTPRVTAEQVAPAMEALLAPLTREEAERVRTALAGMSQATDAEACNAVRFLYRRIPELDEPHRSVLARYVVQ